jgi:dihydrofolate synthase/folylpolyglutamate synthase
MPPIPNPQSPIPSADPALAKFTQLFGPEFNHGKPFDLEPLRTLTRGLQAKLPPVVHVAGTNGKGSTIAFLRAITEAAGWRAHAFTKPHLFKLNERFIVGGDAASDEALIATAERIAVAAPGLTQFDAQIAVALTLFSETPADLAIIETGMGGRDDSTNVVAWPALSVIAPIGLDHQDALGDTLAEIAAHKAGIIKPHAPVIVARQAREAIDVIETQAARAGALLFRAGVEWDAFASSGRLVVQTETQTLDLPLPARAGRHQIDNAGLAAAAMLLGPFKPGEDAIARGIAQARWPARLQPLTRGPFSAAIRAKGGEVWVDAGHNAHAAAALADALRDMQRARPRDTVAIIGLRKRKDAATFVQTLRPALQHIIAVPLSEEHAEPQDIARIAHEAGAAATTASSLTAAMQNAAQLPAPRVLICGSFLLAAEALAAEGA